MGTICAPLFMDLFLYSYEAEFIEKQEKQISCCALQFDRQLDIIDAVLVIKNDQFHLYAK
jgi:hypothetical protein